MSGTEGMFYQIHDYQDGETSGLLPLLWLPDGKNMEKYQITVHLFGAISSPSANFTLHKTVPQWWDELATFIHSDV